MPYLKLFHGRKTPETDLEDWGQPGPIFGPFPYFHTTYGCEIQFSDHRGYVLKMVSDLVYYAGLFYGDWSVFDGPLSEEDARRHIQFEARKADVPVKFGLCACMEPGYFHCGVPGVIAHLENGRLLPEGKVERCDQCGRYPSDDAARTILQERGLIPETQVQLYDVRCYVTVCVDFNKVAASTPQDAARIADALFNWDEHEGYAELVDEMNEYVVEPQDAPDFDSAVRFNAALEEID